MSKLINTNTTTVFNVRNDKNQPIPNYFIVKNNETKEYVVSNAQVKDVSELSKDNIVSPVTKNYSDAQDMVLLLGADVTLKHITPEGLTAIRSARGKKAWAKKKELAKANA
jgi:hypothetical protein